MAEKQVVECASPVCDKTFSKKVHNQKYHSESCKQYTKNLRRRSPFEVSLQSSHINYAEEAVIEDNLEEDFDANRVEYLRKENRRLGNLYLRHKYHKEETIQAVYNAVYDAFSQKKFEPIKPPSNLGSGKKDIRIANPVLSDWQIGKSTPSYNSDVCAERIDLYGDKVVELVEKHRQVESIEEAHVHFLGDIVEGETIFPGQYFEIDSSLYSQIVNGAQIATDFLTKMLHTFKRVHVAAIIGNHGRLGRRGDYNPESNMDRLLYKILEMRFENEPRITFDIPDGDGASNFYLVDHIGKYKVLMMHGDQLGQPTSQHSYYKKILGWKDSGITEDFDEVIIGHWHQNTKSTFGQVVLRIAGTPESDNLYAQERLGVMGRPSQHFQLIDPVRGEVGAEYDLYLD